MLHALPFPLFVGYISSPPGSVKTLFKGGRSFHWKRQTPFVGSVGDAIDVGSLRFLLKAPVVPLHGASLGRSLWLPRAPWRTPLFACSKSAGRRRAEGEGQGHAERSRTTVYGFMVDATFCWYLRWNHHSRISWVVQDVGHSQYGGIGFRVGCYFAGWVSALGRPSAGPDGNKRTDIFFQVENCRRGDVPLVGDAPV